MPNRLALVTFLLSLLACAGAQHPADSDPSARLRELSERYWTLNLRVRAARLDRRAERRPAHRHRPGRPPLRRPARRPVLGGPARSSSTALTGMEAEAQGHPRGQPLPRGPAHQGPAPRSHRLHPRDPGLRRRPLGRRPDERPADQPAPHRDVLPAGDPRRASTTWSPASTRWAATSTSRSRRCARASPRARPPRSAT